MLLRVVLLVRFGIVLRSLVPALSHRTLLVQDSCSPGGLGLQPHRCVFCREKWSFFREIAVACIVRSRPQRSINVDSLVADSSSVCTILP